jgi:hypothetical protein
MPDLRRPRDDLSASAQAVGCPLRRTYASLLCALRSARSARLRRS